MSLKRLKKCFYTYHGKIIVMLILISVLAGLIAILFAGILAVSIMRQPAGNSEMHRIARAIQKGASAFLNRQYRTAAIFVIVVAVLMYFFLGAIASLSFVLGSLLSSLAGYIGMMISVRANVRT